MFFLLLFTEKLYIREYTSGILRNSWSRGYCGQTCLNSIFALFRDWQSCINFAFVLTPTSSVVKSIRQTWLIFFTFTAPACAARLRTHQAWSWGHMVNARYRKFPFLLFRSLIKWRIILTLPTHVVYDAH